MSTFKHIKDRLDNEQMGPVKVSPEEIRALDEELNSLCRSTASHGAAAEAIRELDELGELQEVLATLYFKHKIQLTPSQAALVRQFDRSDDNDAREHLFRLITEGHFLK